MKDSLLCAWRRTFAENAVRAFQGPDRSVPPAAEPTEPAAPAAPAP